MSIFSLFSLMGCKANSVEEAKNTSYGNFTIRQIVNTEKESGSVGGREFTTSSYLIKYEIYFKGKKVKFPTALQKGSDYNYVWQVHILKDAVRPALLAGSQQLFLITEEKNQVKVTRLSQHEATFSSVQWLDSNQGIPANEHNTWQPQNDDWLDSSLVLSGGKYLLINHATVLNTQTMQYWQFNRQHLWETQGWKILYEINVGHEIAVGFSETYKQVVFRALKLDEKSEGRYYSGLAVFDYEKDTLSIVPFSRTPLHLEGIEMLNAHLFHRFFEWKQSGKLGVKENIAAISWQGKLNFPDKDYINYTLFPVKESLVQELINFLQTKHISSASPKGSAVTPEKDYETVLSYKVRIDNTLFEIEYQKDKKTLTLIPHFSQDFSDICRKVIELVSEDFNNALSTGKYQEHFLPFPNDAATSNSTTF